MHTSGWAQGGLLLCQQLVQLDHQLIVAAHVILERSPEAPEIAYVVPVGARVQQRGEELLPQRNVPVPVHQRTKSWRGYHSGHHFCKQNQELTAAQPFKCQFRLVHVASTCSGHLSDAHLFPVQHHVCNHAQTKSVNLQERKPNRCCRWFLSVMANKVVSNFEGYRLDMSSFSLLAFRYNWTLRFHNPQGTPCQLGRDLHQCPGPSQ